MKKEVKILYPVLKSGNPSSEDTSDLSRLNKVFAASLNLKARQTSQSPFLQCSEHLHNT